MHPCETERLERASTRSSETSPGLLRVKAGAEGRERLAVCRPARCTCRQGARDGRALATCLRSA
eukprot:4346677-Pleurochrysis_carterae.AAC.1